MTAKDISLTVLLAAGLVAVGCLYEAESTFAGSIVGWGNNQYGQATPPGGDDFVAVAAGAYNSIALRSDGTIVCWGGKRAIELPDSNDFVAIAAGWPLSPPMRFEGYRLALKSDGSIIALDQKSHEPPANFPGLPGFSPAATIPLAYDTKPPEGNGFVAISAGGGHNLALRSDGSIVGWGNDRFGKATPPDGNDFVAVAAGSSYSLALKSDGSIVGWGENYLGRNTPPDGNDFAAIGASGYSLALKSDGLLVVWGDNGRAAPPDGNDFMAISAGLLYSLALKSDGSIVSWPALPGHTPPAGNDFVAISAGYNHSLAISKDRQGCAHLDAELGWQGGVF